MWLHIPEALSACSPESAPSTSPSDEFFQTLEQHSTSRGKSRQWRLWRRAWGQASWIPRLFGQTFARSQQENSEAVSIWWREAFPARISPSLERAQDSAASGLASSSTSSESFATWDRATSSWKTSQQSLFEDSTPFSGRWPKSGLMQSGAVFEHQTLARLMAVIGGGASRGTDNWPTPTRLDSTNTANRTATRSNPDSQHHDGVTLVDATRMWTTPCADDTGTRTKRYQQGGTALSLPATTAWATPSARDWRSGEASDDTLERNARPLNEQATHWATPRARDADKSPRKFSDSHGPHLTYQAYEWSPSHPAPVTEMGGEPTSPATPTSRLQLNPRFVEALMGVRPGWTDFEDSATPSCLTRPKPPCASCGGAPSESGLEVPA